MPSFSRSRDLGRLCALLAASTCILWSQGSPVGNLNGTVKSPDGRPMANVLVLIRTIRGQHQTRTDDQGRFIIPQLTPGKVLVIVGAADMEEIRMESMVVVNQTTTLNLRLRKPTGATVEVIDNSHLPQVDMDVAKAGSIMTMESIADLPLTSDNRVDDVVNRTPGIGVGEAEYVVNGVDSSMNAINVDGTDVRDRNGLSAIKMNNYFIDQIQVLTNGISAKYGNFAGGVINVTTLNGTNEFKGAAVYEITDPKWDVRDKLTPIQLSWGTQPTVPNDQHTTVQNYTFSGPIIKDKVFFAWSLRDQTPTTETHLVTAAPQFGGVPFTASKREYRQDGKLAWQINTDNQVYGDWNQSTQKGVNNASASNSYTSAETLPGTLKTDRGYMSAGWLSVLKSNLFMDLKVSQTQVESGGPGTGPLGGDSVVTWQSLKYSPDHYLFLDNGAGSDLKSKQTTDSGALNFTWMVDAAGTHDLDFGLQATRYGQHSAVSGTPSGYMIRFAGFTQYPTPSPALQYRELVANSPSQTYLVADEPIQGEASTSSWSLYANDSWTLNPHWSFNLGARYDRFHFETSPEGNLATYTSLAPRFSVNYDIMGDTHQVLSLSAGVYAAQPLVGQFYAATVSSSPVERDYAYIGTGGANQGNGLDALLPNGGINWAAWGNNRTGQTGQNNPFATSDPLQNRNVFVDPQVKAPHSNELHVAYHYTSTSQNFSAALTRRWTFDQITQVSTGNAATSIATTVLTNDSSLRQDYYALLLTYDAKVGQNLTLGGNLTWSRNFSNAGMTVQYGSSSFGGLVPTSQLNPYGPTAQEDMPILINTNANYKLRLGPGTLNLGGIMTYTGSWCFGVPQAFVYAGDDVAAQGFSNPYYMRQFPELGPIWMAAFLKFDLQIGYEMPVYRAATAFVRFNIQNLFNYRPSEGPYTSTNAVDASGNWPADGKAAGVQYQPDPLYQGSPYFYQPGRTLQVVAGIRF